VTDLLHHDRPPCPRCKAQTVMPAVFPDTSAALVCVCCGYSFDGDLVVVERAYRAEEAWAKYSAEADRMRNREKAPPRKYVDNS